MHHHQAGTPDAYYNATTHQHDIENAVAPQPLQQSPINPHEFITPRTYDTGNSHQLPAPTARMVPNDNTQSPYVVHIPPSTNSTRRNPQPTPSTGYSTNPRDMRVTYEIQDLHRTILSLQDQVIQLQQVQQEDRAAMMASLQTLVQQNRGATHSVYSEPNMRGIPPIPPTQQHMMVPPLTIISDDQSRPSTQRATMNVSPMTVPSTVPSIYSRDPPLPAPTAPIARNTSFNDTKTDIQLLTEAFTGLVEPTKLKLPQFKGKKKVFKTWKQDCLTTMTANKKYKSMTEKINGTRRIAHAISDELNEELFASLTKALNDDTKIEVGLEDFADTLDGIGVWNALEREYGLKVKEEGDVIDLLDELKNIKRQKDESVKQYHARFMRKFEECEVNRAISLPAKEYYFLYLKNMNEPSLHQSMIAIKTKTTTGREWKESHTFKAVRDKAIATIKADRILNGNSSNPPPANNSTHSKQRHEKYEKKDTTPTKLNEKGIQLKKKLKGKSVEEQGKILKEAASVSPCILHPDGDHDLLNNCRHIDQLCKEARASEALHKLRRSEKDNKVSARRSSTRLLREKKDLKRREEQIHKREKQMLKQHKQMTKEFHSLASALRVTASNPTAQAQGFNPYTAFDSDSSSSDEDDISYSADEDESDDDTVSDVGEIGYDDNNSNNNVNPYHHPTHSILRTSPDLSKHQPKETKHVSFDTPVHHNILAKVKRTKSELEHATEEVDVTDSGATHNMRNKKDDFTDIREIRDANGNRYMVELGDGSLLEIHGEGPVIRKIHDKIVRYWAYYVPGLSVPLYSIKQHMRKKGCYFHAEDNTAILAFPTFSIELTTEPEITMKSTNANHVTNIPDFDESTAMECKIFTEMDITLVNPKWIRDDIDIQVKHAFKCRAKIKTIHPDATKPSRRTRGSIGYDITSIQNVIVPPNQTVRIRTGVQCLPPPDTYVRIAPRSSMALTGITVQGGVIDPDYTGEIEVLLHNSTDTPTAISKKNKIAQIIFEQAKTPLIELTDHLPPTQKSKKGFGSTGRRMRKRGLFHIDDKTSIWYDLSNPRRQRAKRVNRPIVTGIHNPLLNMNQSTSTAIVPHTELRPTPEEQKKEKALPTIQSQPVHQVNSSEPKTLHMSHDNLLQAIGFIKPEKLLRNIDILGNGNVTISNMPRKERVDPGETATMPSKRKNTTPMPPPKEYSDIWHMDIGFGPCTAISGARYTLLLIDKHTRYRRVYPLKDLRESLLKAIKQFYKDAKVHPKMIRTDFDPKLIQGKVADYIERQMHTDLQAAPPKRQHQNGLVERAWQTIVAQARNWMTSQLLPSKYWYFAVKRAAEVNNIMPTTHIKNKVTTPFELVHGRKVDYRQLFPMFSTAYIKKERDQGGRHKNKFKSQSIKCIVVGRDTKSDALMFYHPLSKQVITCQDGYRLDTFGPSGPQFAETFDGNFTFNNKGSMERIHRPASFEIDNTVYIQVDNKYEPAVVLHQPINEDDEPYTIRIETTDEIRDVMSSELKDHNPTAPIQDTAQTTKPFPLIPWIQNEAKVTLFLHQQMKHPQQGYLQQEKDQWTFHPGRKINNPNKHPIILHHFNEIAQSMVNNKKLFDGWRNARTVLTARLVRASSNIIAHKIAARHISAKTLEVLKAPTLSHHKKLPTSDKLLWDAAYREEYEGLLRLGTWEVITEAQYRLIQKTTGAPLPTMAISTIKKDKDGSPKRCKYRIVALGNLDPHQWSKSDCFAPVISQSEVRLLCSISAQMKRIPKSGDVSQAFCQGVLPEGEEYVIRPPPGCPITPKNSYWKLVKTLYGLKRSPRHWYEKAKSILQELGLQQVQGSPCIFHGRLQKNLPPIYVGLYVDDFIYFSDSDSTEELFKEKFGQQIKTTFEGDISHFLGIAFNNTRHADGHVTIHLSQEAFTETVLERMQLDGPNVGTVATPYRSGHPVDKIPKETYNEHTQAKINHKLQQLTGCFQWLATSTRPDIATITNVLSKCTHKATKGHLDACKYVGRYLKGTKHLGIEFTSRRNCKLEAFVKFPIDPNSITPFTDANWGPQDQSKPKPKDPPLELFKSRSISGFIIWSNGPIHWMSKRQTITARSSAESEIYATDECVKYLIYLRHRLEDLNMTEQMLPKPTTIYNDNAACVTWSNSMTTKGLRHIQMRENAVREQVQGNHIRVKHIRGILNISDMFTKEDKDGKHFITIRDYILTPIPQISRQLSVNAEPIASKGGDDERVIPVE